MARATTLPVAQKPLTNNVYIDGILWGGKYYSSSGSSPTKIDYSFWNSTASILNGDRLAKLALP